jgi:hypothetical protein
MALGSGSGLSLEPISSEEEQNQFENEDRSPSVGDVEEVEQG